MKKRFFSVCAAIAAVCVMAFSLVGCGETPEPEAVPTAISLNKETAAVYVGESIALTATVTDQNGEKMRGLDITWTSADESIATVSKGSVKGVKDGEVNITAAINDLKAVCKVTVSTKQVVTITAPEDLSLVVGSKETLTLTATATDNSAITWSSSDETAATVKDGVVTAQPTAGQKTVVTITAKSETAGEATCDVTVYNNGSTYEIVRNSSNATVIADPGVWYWFAKGAAAGHYGFTDENNPTYTNGTIDLSMAFLEADNTGSYGDSGITQWEFRYQPIFAADSAYTMTFTLTTNTDITLKFDNNLYDFKAGTHEVTFTGTVNASFPLNIRLMTPGGTAEAPLDTPMIIKMAGIKVTEGAAENPTAPRQNDVTAE